MENIGIVIQKRGYDFYFYIRKQPNGDEMDKVAVAYPYQLREGELSIYNSRDERIEAIPGAPVIKGLEGVEVLEGTTTNGNGAYYKDNGKILYKYIPNKNRDIRTFRVHEGTEILRDGSFSENYLSKIILPPTLKVIGNGVFEHSDNLQFINLPEGLERIGIRAFANCCDLEEINIPGSVKVIEKEAFANCYMASKIILNEGLEEIGERAFFSANEVTEIQIPSSVKSIGYKAFFDTNMLRKVWVPKSVVSMGVDVFVNWADDTAIYCEAESKPDGWSDSWVRADSRVGWGQKIGGYKQ